MNNILKTLASSLSLTLATVGSAHATTQIEIVVPAYFYPSFSGSDWDRMRQAIQPGVRITAIMNPGSGPGTAANSDYTRAIASFRQAGGRVLGYVPSGYIGRVVNAGSSCQPSTGTTYQVSDIVGCADRYESFYGTRAGGEIDGLFVDEMNKPIEGATDAELTSFYSSLYDGLKGINPNWTIMGNPGAGALEGLLRNGANTSGGADSLVTFEDYARFFDAAVPPAYQGRYGSERFANIVIETGPAFNFEAALQTAAGRNVGFFYATDDLQPNPYDRLPTNWDAQVSAVRSFNTNVAAVPEPGTWTMMVTGFGICGLAIRRRRQRFALSTA